MFPGEGPPIIYAAAVGEEEEDEAIEIEIPRPPRAQGGHAQTAKSHRLELRQGTRAQHLRVRAKR